MTRPTWLSLATSFLMLGSAIPALAQAPDLTNSAAVQATYATGATPQINVTVNRSGGPLTLGTYVEARLYRSTNTTFDGGDTLLWNSNNSTPDYPNSTLNSSGAITRTATSAALPAGTYYILAVVDPTHFHTNETNTGNNVQAYAVTVSSPPDLTNSAAVQATYTTGATPQINVTVNRTGGNLTLGTYVEARLYRSTDTTFSAGTDTLLWNSNNATPDYPNSTLNSNGSITRTATSAALPAGSYYILAVVDPTHFHTNETNTGNNVQAYAVTVSSPPPDLTISTNAASSYATGATPQINVTVNRSGGSLTLGTYVEARLYRSTNTVFDGSDTLLWNSNNATPDYPNSTLNSSGSLTRTATSAALPAGTYYILAVVDPTHFHTNETNTGNNVQAYAVTVSSPPDLTNSAVVQATYAVGATPQINVTVNRTGGNLTAGTYVEARLYLSTNTTFDGGDALLWNSNNATPDYPNSTLNSSGSVTRTATSAALSTAGSYYILAVVDPTGFHTEETNTSNNVQAYAVTITATPPDLTNSAVVQATYAVGATPQINVTVNRTGGALTVGTYVEARLYLSTNTTFDGGDALLWNSNNATPDYPNSTLNSSGSITRTATTTALSTAGSFYILAVVDPTAFHTEETNTSNNVQAYAVTITAATPPDLTNSAVVQATYAVGATPQINVTVNRTGGNLTTGTYVEARLYLSTNTVFDGGDALLWNSNNGTPDYPNSTLNSSGSITRTATTTALSTAGSFYILAVVDPTAFHTEETNTTNNVQAYAVTITATPPDLTISTTYVPGTTYIAGEPLSIQATVTRTGGALGGSYVQVRLFLSTDSVYQPFTDTQLWQSNDATPDFSVADLNLNGSRTRTATILAPNQSGSFFLLAVVDRPDGAPHGADGFHVESNPNNNIEARAFAVDRGLWGRVTLASGSPLANATIAINPVGLPAIRQSVTDSAGVYRLPSSGLAVQDYEVVPSLSGYGFTPSFHRINGLNPAGVYPNFDFSGAGPNTTTPRTISGTVFALGGAPLSGATVKAFLSPTTLTAQTVTAANGTYTLASNIYANSYSVQVEAGGRFFLARQANATQGNVAGLDFYEQQPNAPIVAFDTPTAQLFQKDIHASNQSQTITVEVFTQGSGSPTVTLEHRSIGAAPWTSVSMTNTSGVVWSHALAAGSFTSPGVEVRVVATHNAQTTTTPAHQLRVGNRPPSQVTIVGVSATDPPILKATGQSHSFEAFVAEPDGDSVTVTVFYARMGSSESSAAMTPTGVPGRYSGTIPGTSIQSAVPTFYYVKAVDQFGASAQTPRLQINRIPPRQGQPRQAQTVADPINAASGNYLFSKEILTLQAHGRSFSITLSYNALAPASESLGYGWTHDFDTVIQPLDDGSLFVRGGDGGKDSFVPAATPNTWVCQDRAIRGTITKDASDNYAINELGGGRILFNALGRVSRVESPDGVALVLTWDAPTRRLLNVQIQPAGLQYTFGYDAAGLISSIQDGTGRQVVLTHDGAGNLIDLEDVGNEHTRFEYDANHRATQIVLPVGNKLLSNAYDAQGRVIEQFDGAGARWQLAYDTPVAGTTTVTRPDGRVRRVQHGGREEWLDLVREDGRQVQVQYGSNGLPSSLTTPDQQTYQLLYDAQGNVQSSTAPGGHTESMTWDVNNRLASATEPGNYTTSLTRDGAGRVTQLADQLGSVNYTFTGVNLVNVNDRLNGNSQLGYDALGNVNAFTDPAGVGVTISRDARGNVTGRTTPTRTTTTQVDAHGRPVRITDSVAGEFTFGYDANGNLVVFTTPLGTTRYLYDANDQLVVTIDPANNQTTYVRDSQAQIVRVRNALGDEWVLTRDELGRVTKVTSPEGREITYTYDWAGRILTRTDAGGTTTFVRDGRGLVIEVVDQLTNRWRFTRDGRGLVTKVTDPLNRETNYEYDAGRRLTAVVDARNRRTVYTHDAHQLRDAGRPSGTGNAQYGYDAAGRPTSRVDGMGRSWTSTLTNGRLASIQRPDGSVLSLTYAASGRLQSMSVNGGETRTFTYDAAGLLATAATSAGTTRTLYNHRGQIVSREDEFTNVVLASYDAVGRLSTLTYNGVVVTYTYDRDGLLLRVMDSFNRVVDYGHDARGLLVRVTYPNGVVTTITRDAAGQMTGLQHEKAGTVLAAWTITVDPVGNRTRIACTAGSIPWNLPSSVRDFTVSPTGQVQTQGASAFQHDQQGRLTSWPTASGTRTLTYTGYGRLASMTGGGAATTYRYDADDEVIAIIRNGVETRFIQDLTGPMSRILVEKDGANMTRFVYVHGLGLAYQIEVGGGPVRFYHSDPNGNVVLLTDENGAPTDRYAYTPFGELVGSVGSSANPFRFGGSLGVFEAGDGTLVMRRRVYAPELGRFLSPDPVEQPKAQPQGRNLYAYALNNPWGFVDPTGLTGQRDGSQADPIARATTGIVVAPWETQVSASGQHIVAAGVRDAADGLFRGVSHALESSVYKTIEKVRKAWDFAQWWKGATDINAPVPGSKAPIDLWLYPVAPGLEAYTYAREEIGGRQAERVSYGSLDVYIDMYRSGDLTYEEAWTWSHKLEAPLLSDSEFKALFDDRMNGLPD